MRLPKTPCRLDVGWNNLLTPLQNGTLVFIALLWGCGVDSTQKSSVGTDTGISDSRVTREELDMGSSAPVDAQSEQMVDLSLTDGAPMADGSVAPDSDRPVTLTNPNHLDQTTLFQCDGQPTSSPPRLRRMERRELTYTMSRPMTALIPGTAMRHNPMFAPAHHPYSTYSQDNSVDVTALDMYLGVHETGWHAWANRNYHGIHRISAASSYMTDIRCILPVYSEDAASRPDMDCIDKYVRELLETGVLNRPPTDAEFNALRDYAQSVFEEEVDPFRDRSESLSDVITAAWLTTGALFRDELGGEPDEDGRAPLGTWALAKALAYTLDDRAGGVSATQMRITDQSGDRLYSAPGGTYLPDIRTAAEAGTIHDPDTIRQLVRQYAAGYDPARMDLALDYSGVYLKSRSAYWMSNKVRRFFREWLGYEKARTVFKDTPWATTAYHDAERVLRTHLNQLYNFMNASTFQSSMHEPDFVHQLDDTIARIVLDDVDVLGQLLTSNRFYLPASHDPAWDNADDPDRDPLRYLIDPMAHASKIYGIESPIPFDQDGRWTELPPDRRSGVLTHPAWLAAHGGNFEDDGSLIERGHWIRENLLCQDVPGLELVQVEAQLVGRSPEKRARDRVTESIESNPECMGCHRLMNSLGKPFEIFNHAGILRTDDHGHPPDGTSLLEFMPEDELNGPVEDAIELTTRLADSGHVKRCFIRQTFRFFMGRNETAADACTLSAMEDTYDESGGSFMGMLETLTTSGTFLYRTHGEQEASDDLQ